ncbi:MAG: hypothetical protein FWH05_07295 [Oscillospiraceae bacterium]|nr:hypothetical protein [Oscillospiraceae bacterium]
MSILIPNLILIVLGSAYAVLFKRKLAETIFLAVVTVVAVLYCFGLISTPDCLLWGIYFLCGLSLACLAFVIYKFIKDKGAIKEIELLQGCLIYAAILLFALFVNAGRWFSGWDEFSHWGTIVKHFYTIDALGNVPHPNYTLIFPGYLPGTSLFQYFFVRFSVSFKEYYLYIAMNIMYFSMVIPFIKNVFNKDKWLKCLGLLAVFFTFPLLSQAFEHSFYSTLYVDEILGAFFGFALLYYFVYEYNKSQYGIAMVSSAVFMLTVTKDMGLLLALGVIAIIILDVILFRRSQIKDYFNRKTGILYKLKAFVLAISPLFGALFVTLSWPKSRWYTPTLNDIYALITGQLEPYQKETRWNFVFDAMWRPIPGIGLNVIHFSLIFIAVVLFLSFFKQKNINIKRMAVTSLSLVAGLFLYQFVLLAMYVFSFSEFEAVRLASYERYTTTYLLGMLFFSMLFYILRKEKPEKILSKINSDELIKYKDAFRIIRTAVSAFLLCVLIANCTRGIGGTIAGRVLKPQPFETRPTAIAAEKWRDWFEIYNPYLIAQEENGSSYYIMRYELMPYSKLANVRLDYSISTEPYWDDAGDDPWTFIVTPEEWEEHVLSSGYELLYVYKSNEQLETTYSQFFPHGVEEDMCYYVQNNDGNLALVPVVLH